MEDFHFNQIIYLSNSPLKYLEKGFHISELKNINDLEVKFWNLTQIVFGEKTNEEKNIFEKNISNLNQFENEIKLQKNQKSLYISLISYEFSTIHLYYILKKYNCKTLFFARGALPQHKIISRLKTLDYNRIVSFCKNRIALLIKYLKIVNTHDYLLISGKEGYKTIGIGSEIDIKKSKIYYINALDKEIFDKTNNKLLENKNKIAFLDEYLPFHPDNKLLNLKTLSENKYFKELNLFFSYLELKLKVQVVICAHPKSEKYKTKNYFENRKIYFNETNEIVKASRGVICHASTSVNFAVLSKKPITFISSNLIKHYLPLLDKQIILNSKILKANFINIDNIENEYYFHKLNEVKYNAWIKNYLSYKVDQNKSETSEILKEILFKKN